MLQVTGYLESGQFLDLLQQNHLELFDYLAITQA